MIAGAQRDADDQVRRLAVVAAALPDATAHERAVVEAAMRDASPMVRFEGLRAYGRHFQSADCGPVRASASDANRHVALLAIDLLGDPCPDAQASLGVLDSAVADGEWHRAAHALVALARRAPDRARPLLARFVTHAIWQVRMYAARAATAMADAAALETLAADRDDNVREAAVSGLVTVRGHAADAAFIAALGRPDYQLVRTAARALENTEKRKAASVALLAAFERISRERRETSRDVRLALLQRLRDLEPADLSTALEPYLKDFDPRVAGECALTLLASSGRGATISSTAAPAAAVPPASELAALTGARARITMEGGGSFELALLTDDAPLSAARFARLARAGYYNGLTFHRVLPNFVIQGGSPGANEYAGDGPFMRDEVGLRSNARGTVGISTRGRDTGDAQIFVNLVDNDRLDHIYTVFADIIPGGMEVVDGIVEGDRMVKVEIVK
jgi:cyclophilin family peptidyl-prolyl cis-trans isomerase